MRVLVQCTLPCCTTSEAPRRGSRSEAIEGSVKRRAATGKSDSRTVYMTRCAQLHIYSLVCCLQDSPAPAAAAAATCLPRPPPRYRCRLRPRQPAAPGWRRAAAATA